MLTDEQKDDLFIELDSYTPSQIRSLVKEYLQLPAEKYQSTSIYEFLRDKLQLDRYWRIVGLV